MAKIDESLISRLEMLGRIKIDKESRPRIEQDLNKIVSMFDKLAELDTSGVVPLRHISQAINVRREDQIEGQLTNDQALMNAPTVEGGFFAVPKFLKTKK